MEAKKGAPVYSRQPPITATLPAWPLYLSAAAAGGVREVAGNEAKKASGGSGGSRSSGRRWRTSGDHDPPSAPPMQAHPLTRQVGH